MQLRDYQISISDKAAILLRYYKIAYLAMKPRTGKTLTAFETVKKYGAKNVLFVTKKKAIKSIESDYNHYKDIFKCTVINYESVLKKPDTYDIIISDESHSISAYPKPSKRALDLKSISKNLPIIYLSGTPSPESYSQLFHQFFISSFSPFRENTFYKWANEYVVKKERMINGNKIIDYSGAVIAKIEPLIKHLFLTQTQEQAGFENQIIERILYVDMEHSQTWAIEKLIKDRVIITKDGLEILGDTAVKLQSKIHQLSSGSIKTETGEILIISTKKGEYIKEYFKGKKIAVFYKFIGELNILKQVFENWTNDPEEFQASDNKTFLGQFVSSREGVRLDTADAIIFYNIDFSYLSYDQARERIVSKERQKPALLYWVFSKGGIEEKIYRVVKNKKDFTNYYFKKEYGIKDTKAVD